MEAARGSTAGGLDKHGLGHQPIKQNCPEENGIIELDAARSLVERGTDRSVMSARRERADR